MVFEIWKPEDKKGVVCGWVGLSLVIFFWIRGDEIDLVVIRGNAEMVKVGRFSLNGFPSPLGLF